MYSYSDNTNILRQHYRFGDRALGEDGSKREVNDTMRDFPAGIFIVFVPLVFSLMGGLIILGQIPWFLGAYNYLRGTPSPIDQTALALLGSDLTRLAVLISAITGMMIGSFLFRFITKKLDIVRREGEVELGRASYFVLFAWWTVGMWPFFSVNLLVQSLHGFTSRFVTDIGIFLMAGYFLGYAIPVMMKYARLVWHAESIDSRVIMTELRRGSGLVKSVQKLTMRVVHDGPDP